MLKDITLGQFFPGDTVAHKLDPRTKILLVMLYIIALFCANSVLTYALMALVLAVCVRISRVGIRALVRGLKPVLFILIFTCVLNLLFTPGDHYLVEWGILHISKEDAKIIPAAVEHTIHIDIVVKNSVKSEVTAGHQETIVTLDIGNRGQGRANQTVLPQSAEVLCDVPYRGDRRAGIFQILCDIGLDPGQISLRLVG